MVITLQAGDLRVVLDPATGGAIAAFTRRGLPLLRPVIDPRLAAQHGRAVAAYPLIPYANRIDHGRFSMDGETFQLASNFGGDPHSIHGNGWMRPWTVNAATADRACLILDHTPPDDPPEQWPFAYHAELTFTLRPDCLHVALSIENRDTRTWPAGLGLHPYVARTPKTTLQFRAGTIWTKDANGLPLHEVQVQGETEFAEARTLGGAEIDSCYAGWDGAATITQPEHRVGMVVSADRSMHHLQIYTPAGRDFLGVEPVGNIPDAINRMQKVWDHGLVMIAAGDTLNVSSTLSPIDLDVD